MTDTGGGFDTDRFDAHLRMATFWAQRHDKRREWEWKINFGVWGCLTGTVLKTPEMVSGLPTWAALVLAMALGVGVPLAHWVLFLAPLWARNNHDKAECWRSIDPAAALLGLKPNKGGVGTRAWDDWCMRHYLAITCALSGLASVAVLCKWAGR